MTLIKDPRTSCEISLDVTRDKSVGEKSPLWFILRESHAWRILMFISKKQWEHVVMYIFHFVCECVVACAWMCVCVCVCVCVWVGAY